MEGTERILVYFEDSATINDNVK